MHAEVGQNHCTLDALRRCVDQWALCRFVCHRRCVLLDANERFCGASKLKFVKNKSGNCGFACVVC